ncbi:MAG: TIM-barrel domain-containing protein [Fimbriimonadaceae bacterium]
MLLALALTTYATIPGGIVIPEAHGALALRVESNRRIRVTFAPRGAGPAQPALALINPKATVPFTVKTDPAAVTVRTKALTVSFNRKTGALTFSDRHGVLLREPADARTYRPVNISGTRAFAAIQRFEMQPGEAYFGLGGHQRSGLNWRGSSVTLVQRNTETAVPFMLSSRGYGILNNAACGQVVNFGGEAGPIPPEILADDAGTPGALTGHYFTGKNFDTHVGDRRDAKIAFTWTGGSPMAGIASTNYSVRWTGTIRVPRDGDYGFSTRADDGVRVWVDDKLVVDDWAEKPASNAGGHIFLKAGVAHAIRVEYFQAGGEAEVSLQWHPPSSKQEISWQSEFVTRLDYTFIAGPEFDDIIAEYRDATGAAPMFGRWAYGFWQCKERYKTQQELLDIAAGFRSRHIPIDNLVQDWFYWDPHAWGSHHFDEKRYPDMLAATTQLHDEHIHLMISVWGKFIAPSKNYTELNAAHFLYPALNGNERYYDAFDPAARAVYWRQIKDELLSKGIDAWWLDASEPEVPMNLFRPVQTHLGPAAEVLNAYPLMHTGGVYQGQRAAKAGARVFILTRSAFAGQQRNAAAVWSGDVNGDWTTFKKQVSGGLNFCMSGLPYWCTDIGGFFSRPNTDPDYQELFVRWFEWGTFNPIFRVHGTGTDKEPWRWGPEKEKILVKFDKLRYRLLPYIYSVAWKVTHEGYTMMRGLPMDFRDDPKVYDIDDEFMFGPSLLIAPVTKPGATARQVYLPGGVWYNFWTGKRLAGGRTVTVAAPLDSMPIFVRAGSIIPVGPVVEYAEHQRGAPLQLWVYPGANGHFTLYDDDGTDYGYEHGAYTTTRLTWDEVRHKLVVGKREGSYPGMGPTPKLTTRIAPAGAA